jgi:hypothetical protein
MKRVPQFELWARVVVFAAITVMAAIEEPYAPDRDAMILWIALTIVPLIALGINLGEIIYRFTQKRKQRGTRP